MPHGVEAPCGKRVAVPQGYAGVAAPPRVPRSLRRAHQPAPLPEPRYSLASAIIISGVHGGS